MRGGGTCKARDQESEIRDQGSAGQRVGEVGAVAGWAEPLQSCAGGRCANKRPAEKKPSARIEPQNILRRLIGKSSAETIPRQGEFRQ